MPGFRLLQIVLLVVLIFSSNRLFAAEPLEVVIEGVEGDALENARTALAVPPGLVRNGKIDRLWLQRFEGQAAENVRSALQPFGYYQSQVTTSLTTTGEESYRLTVEVKPGPPVLVSAVHVAVDGAGREEEALRGLVRAFPLHSGNILLQQKYEESKSALKARAIELGYLDAEFSAHEIRISEDRTEARIELVLDTGFSYLFNGVVISGAPDYPDRFLRRYLAFKPGDKFSYARLGETQLNFINSERFREAVVVSDKEKAHELRVPVLVQLNPLPRRRLKVGVGYGTDTGARFSIRYRNLNMFHLGHEWHNELYIAQRLQGFASGYIMPGLLDLNSSTGFQLNLQQEDTSTYESRLISAEANRNRSFGSNKLGTVYVKLLQEEFTIGGVESSSRLILPGIRYSERSFDDLLRPSRGYRYALEVRGAHQFLGSDTGLLQVLADGYAIMPLPWRFSLMSRVKAGMTLQNDPLSDIPASIRFFAGGDSSVRGYSYQSLGPRDAAGRVVGGRHLLVGSLELERKLFRDWGVSAFYDAGNAFNSLTNIRLFQGVGLGVRYYTLVGPITLYVARQIGIADPAYRVHFTMGFEL